MSETKDDPTRDQRWGHYEMGLRIQIAKNRDEIPSEDEPDPEWAEWAQTLLDAKDSLSSRDALLRRAQAVIVMFKHHLDSCSFPRLHEYEAFDPVLRDLDAALKEG